MKQLEFGGKAYKDKNAKIANRVQKEPQNKPKTGGVNSISAQKTKNTFLKQVYIPTELRPLLEEEMQREHRDSMTNLIVKILYEHYGQ